MNQVLRWMPEQAQCAFATPSLHDTCARLLEADKYLGQPFFDSALRNLSRDAGKLTGTPDAASLEAVALAVGLDPEAPTAVFLDFTKTLSPSLAAAVAPSAPVPAEGEAAPKAKQETTPPDFVLVLTLKDEAKARGFIDGLLSIPEQTAEDTSNGVSIRQSGELGYFTASGQMIAGSLNLVRLAAGRAADPARTVYGTPACPVSIPGELVGLAYPKRFAGPLKQFAEALGKSDPAWAASAQSETKFIDQLLAGSQDEPLVVTLGWEGNRLELLSRVDTAAFPAIKTLYGTPAPLRCAQWLPENTLLTFAFNLTTETKQTFESQVQPITDAVPSPEVAAGAAYATSLFKLLGQEAALSIGVPQDGIPPILLMAQVADMASAKPLLKNLGTEIEETAAGVEILSVKSGPFPIHMALAEDLAVFATDAAQLKSTLQLVQEKKPGAFLSALTPPIDAQAPCWGGLVFRPAGLQALMPMAEMLTPDASIIRPVIDRLAVTVRELRLWKEQPGSWVISRGTLFLNPLSQP